MSQIGERAVIRAGRPLTKRCAKCGLSKPAILFIRDRHQPSGYTSRCIQCRRQSKGQGVNK